MNGLVIAIMLFVIAIYVLSVLCYFKLGDILREIKKIEKDETKE